VRETLWVSHDDGPAVSGGVQGLLMVVLGVWISDGGVRERERESNMGLLSMESLVLEREVEIIVVRLTDN